MGIFLLKKFNYEIYFFLLFIPFLISCSKDDDNIAVCEAVIIDAQQYVELQSDSFNLLEVNKSQDCLKLKISYGGGCLNPSLLLVDSGDVFESDPPQRNLRLVLTKNDDCQAMDSKEFSFDISSLKIEVSNSVLLNFQNSELTYLYEY